MVQNQVDWRRRYYDKQDQPVEPESTGEKKSLAEQLGIKIDPKPEPVKEEAGTGDEVKVGVQKPEPTPEPVPVEPPDEPVAPEDTAEEPTVDPLTGTPIEE